MTPPTLPKRTVELLPFPPEHTDPQPPPVAHVVRTVLFVDCIGDIPLRVYGVPVVEDQAMLSVKEALWQQVGAGEVRCAPLWVFLEPYALMCLCGLTCLYAVCASRSERSCRR